MKTWCIFVLYSSLWGFVLQYETYQGIFLFFCKSFDILLTISSSQTQQRIKNLDNFLCFSFNYLDFFKLLTTIYCFLITTLSCRVVYLCILNVLTSHCETQILFAQSLFPIFPFIFKLVSKHLRLICVFLVEYKKRVRSCLNQHLMWFNFERTISWRPRDEEMENNESASRFGWFIHAWRTKRWRHFSSFLTLI